MIRLEIESIIKRRNGKKEIIRQPAHSPLKNYVSILKALFDASSETIIDTSGTQQTIDGSNSGSYSSHCNGGTRGYGGDTYYTVEAPEGDHTYGLVAGSGTTPVSMDDYQLDTLYEHGEGAGKLFYKDTIISLIVGGETTIDNTTYKTMTLIIQRPVENRHTENQTINEIGLIMYIKHMSVYEYKVLIFRDVLDNPITLAPTEAVTLRYHLRWLIPK